MVFREQMVCINIRHLPTGINALHFKLCLTRYLVDGFLHEGDL